MNTPFLELQMSSLDTPITYKTIAQDLQMVLIPSITLAPSSF